MKPKKTKKQQSRRKRPLPKVLSQSLVNIFRQALVSHQAGRLVEAEELYHRILRAAPGHHDSLCNLGSIRQQQGRLEEAATYYQRVLAENTTSAIALSNLGVVLNAQGKVDEAIGVYQRALALDPGNARTHNNLGSALQQQGRLAEALACYEQAVAIMPDYHNAIVNMGLVFLLQTRTEEAIVCYRRALALDPENGATVFQLADALNQLQRRDEAIACLHKVLALNPAHPGANHLLAALTGRQLSTASSDYVAGLFDNYAAHFDSHLVEKLAYAIPFQLRQALDQFVSPGTIFHHGMDLGCGTGLSGEAFRSLVEKLSGIDLSAKMLAQAAAKNIYSQLYCGDITEFLQASSDSVNLFVATDVFVYMGDLTALFKEIRRCAAPGAFFVFSTEKTSSSTAGYQLLSSGRFGHNESYITSLAAAGGFAVRVCRSANIRMEKDQWIPGNIYILQVEPNR